MAFYVHLPSVSIPLLLRISPKTFVFILILPMCLSSPNRSIHAVFRHFLPCVAPLCKALHYSKTRVPWQIKSTLIIVLIYSFCPKMPCFASNSVCFVKCVNVSWFKNFKKYRLPIIRL